MRQLKAAAVRVLLSCFCSLILLPAAYARAAPPDQKPFDIDPQALAAALSDFARQSGREILYTPEVVADRRSNELRGLHEPIAALKVLLKDSGLDFTTTPSGAILIGPPVSGSPASSASPSATSAPKTTSDETAASKGERSFWGRLRLAQAPGSNSVGSTSQNSAEGAASRSQIEEVVVTAQKREQRLLDVPLSITALDYQDIERRGLVGQADYLRSIPGVSQIDAGVGNTSVIIRGVSADPQNTDRGAKATVGYYLNDIPLTGYILRGGADVKLIDLDRVEVIRGPQGTLYGSGSLGGTVRNIPNAPKFGRFEGRVSATYSATEQQGGSNGSLEGVLNLPLIDDRLAVRAVGYWFDNSGFVDNVAASTPATVERATLYGVPELAQNESEVGGDRYTGGRIALLYQPIDSLKATLTFLKQDITQFGLPDAEPARAGRFQQARLQVSDVVGGGSERLEDDLEIYNATFEYSFGFGSIVSSTSLVKETYLEKREIGSFFTPSRPPVAQRNVADTDAFAQELRFASEFSGPFQLLTGLYYEEADRNFINGNYFGGRTNLGLTPFPSPVITDSLQENTIEQKAVFGEASYAIGPVEATIGARAFEYDDETVTTNLAVTPNTITRIAGENDGTTYKANLSWKPTDSSLLYAQYTQGFRLGSPVAAANATCDLDGNGIIDSTSISAGPRTLDPDELDTYEVGTKLALANGAVIVSASAYQNTWSGVPVLVVVPCGFSVRDNAGEAQTTGVELSTDFRVARQLKVSLAAAYTEAELTRDAPTINGLDGDRLPGSPKYSAHLGAEYELTLFQRPSFLRADYTRVGGFYNNFKETGIEAGDYGLLNLRAGTTVGSVGFDLFVNNVTNEDAPTWVDATFTGSIARLYRLRPRTVGIAARFQF